MKTLQYVIKPGRSSLCTVSGTVSHWGDIGQGTESEQNHPQTDGLKLCTGSPSLLTLNVRLGSKGDYEGFLG